MPGYGVTPVDATTTGRTRSNPASASRPHPSTPKPRSPQSAVGGALSPVREPPPDLVVQHMRRRIGVDVRGPPQGGPERVVGRGHVPRQPKSFEKSSSALRWVSEYQLPLSSRKIASMPYGRSWGSWMNSTPRARNVS
ncbi:hypothetical protein M2162_003703 [Streptomyces sp. SAI-041]|nr:hypothetical protein [Streptomyces sp. SAI-041]